MALISEDGQTSRIFECKTANPFTQTDGGDPSGDQVPASYLVQCVWYMILTRIDRINLAVPFGNANFRIYEITQDLELELMALERAISFCENYVLTDMPPATTSESDYKSLIGKSIVSKSIEAPAKTSELIKKLKSLN